jgi:hypothetical protein
MEAWQDLDAESFGSTYNMVWDALDAEFQFNPHNQPAIAEPSPYITYKISQAFTPNAETQRTLITDLSQKSLAAFQKCTATNQRLYALDWQHQGYWFYPHGERTDRWLVPMFPDGDYYIFLAKDFSFGTFGHPWEESICVFGRPLLDAFAQDPPLLFHDIIRSVGV